MAAHVIDLAAFRVSFPAFSDAGKFSDALLTLRFDEGTGFLGAYDGPLLAGTQMQQALNYMAAHLLASGVLLAAGQTAVIVTGSTVDKVQVQMAPPPTKDLWQWWLATTPYGAQLWALLSLRAAGGFYVGGSLDRYALRGATGFRGRRWP